MDLRLVAQFAALSALTIGCCVRWCVSAAEYFLRERAGTQLAPLNREALGIGPLNR